MGTIGMARRRRDRPRCPDGELVLSAPPEPERIVPAGVLARMLPAVMLLGSLGFVAVLGVGNPTSWLFGGMFALSTVGMMTTGGGRGGGQRSSTIDEERRDYLRYLSGLRRQLRSVAQEQRRVAELLHPDPAAWAAVIAHGRLWERRPDDDDFAHVRLGVGPQRLAVRLVAPPTGPVEGIEPITALALRRFLVGHAAVPDLPVALDLRTSTTVWLEPADTGDLRPARALARAIVAHLVLWHSPCDVGLAVVVPPSQLRDWEWVKWLPHAAHPHRRDGAGPIRMITDDADELRRWWIGEPSDRHLLAVVDGTDDAPGAWAGGPGVTVLRVGAPAGRRPAPSVVRLCVGAGTLHRRGPEADATVGRPDALELAEALALARRLARYRPDGDGPGTTRSAGPAAVPGLPTLLRLDPGPAGIDALRTRWQAAEADRLRVPIGVDESGAPVVLDLKEAALGGSGPHGLCIGATGSGKSNPKLWHTLHRVKFPRPRDLLPALPRQDRRRHRSRSAGTRVP